MAAAADFCPNGHDPSGGPRVGWARGRPPAAGSRAQRPASRHCAAQRAPANLASRREAAAAVSTRSHGAVTAPRPRREPPGPASCPEQRRPAAGRRRRGAARRQPARRAEARRRARIRDVRSADAGSSLQERLGEDRRGPGRGRDVRSAHVGRWPPSRPVAAWREPVSPDTADALMDRAAPAAGSPVSRRARRATSSTVTDEGTKLSSKLVLDLAASGDAPGGYGHRHLDTTAAGGIQAAHDVRQPADRGLHADRRRRREDDRRGPSTGAFPSRVGTSSWGSRRGDGLDLGTEDRRPRRPSRSSSTSGCPPSSRSTACSVPNAPGAERIPARHPRRDRRRRPGHTDALETGLIRRPRRYRAGRSWFAGQRLADAASFLVKRRPRSPSRGPGDRARVSSSRVQGQFGGQAPR